MSSALRVAHLERMLERLRIDLRKVRMSPSTEEAIGHCDRLRVDFFDFDATIASLEHHLAVRLLDEQRIAASREQAPVDLTEPVQVIGVAEIASEGQRRLDAMLEISCRALTLPTKEAVHV